MTVPKQYRATIIEVDEPHTRDFDSFPEADKFIEQAALRFYVSDVIIEEELKPGTDPEMEDYRVIAIYYNGRCFTEASE